MVRSKSGGAERRHLRISLIAGTAVAGILCCTGQAAATAQIDDAPTPSGTPIQSSDAQGASTPSDVLEEVIVTARRRAESLERVPVAVMALTGAQLASRGVEDTNDLQQAFPGLTVRQTENQNQINFSIRGQSVDAFSGSNPAVLAYINDVQQSSAGTSSLYDLDSVQVLEGPQGTLFGRNVTGGAVLFSTAKPADHFGGYFTERLGNLNLVEERGAVDVPLVGDKLLLRIAGDIDNRDGFQHNYYDGRNLGEQDRQSGRVTLLMKPIDQFVDTLVIQVNHATGNDVSPAFYSSYPCGATHNGVPLATAATCFYSPGLDNLLGAPGAWASYLAAHPKAPFGGLAAYGPVQEALGPWGVSEDWRSANSSHSYYLTNTTIYDLGSDTQIKNIFGISDSHAKNLDDLDGTPYTIDEQFNGRGGLGNIVVNSQGSDELQVLGKTFSQQLNYVAGVYYASERQENYQDLDVFDLTPVLPPPAADDADFQVSDRTEAVYFQGTYDLSSITGLRGLSSTAGFRYSWEQVGISQLAGSLRYGAPNESASFSDPSWQIGLEYQISSDLLFYVGNRGSWRGGGFNGAAPALPGTASQGGNLFLPETTHDIELGAKFRGDLLGRPASLNVAIYDQKIYDVQRVLYVVIQGVESAVTANIPAADVRGVEVGAQAALTNWLDVGANASLTDARYTRPSVDLFDQTFTFGPYADTPKWVGTAYAVVHMPIPEHFGTLSVRGQIYAQTAQYFSNLDNTSSPGTRLPGYGLFDFRLEWNHIAKTGASLAAFVKNAGDKPYFVGGVAQGAAFGVNAALPGEPRTFGVELGYRF